MVHNKNDRNLAEENQALKARVADLERQLSQVRRGAGAAPTALDPKQLAAEKAISGFFDQPLVMLFIADLVEGRYLRVNQKVCDVLGFSEKEILESSFLDRVHPDDHSKTMLEMQKLISGRATEGFTNRHLDANGGYRVFRWTAVADENRELCYAMAIEVTE